MSALSAVTAKVVIRVLQRFGFVIARQAGSHVRLRHLADPTRNVTVPYHGRDITKKTLLSILRQAKIGVEEFKHMLRQ